MWQLRIENVGEAGRAGPSCEQKVVRNCIANRWATLCVRLAGADWWDMDPNLLDISGHLLSAFGNGLCSCALSITICGHQQTFFQAAVG